MFSPLSACLSVCLLTGLLKIYWSNLYEILWNGWTWYRDKSIGFWLILTRVQNVKIIFGINPSKVVKMATKISIYSLFDYLRTELESVLIGLVGALRALQVNFSTLITRQLISQLILQISVISGKVTLLQVVFDYIRHVGACCVYCVNFNNIWCLFNVANCASSFTATVVSQRCAVLAGTVYLTKFSASCRQIRTICCLNRAL